MDATTIYNKVSEHYSASALGTNNTQYGQSVAKSFGYTEEELASIPAESNLGLSCGNPLAIASLKEGETLIDLGSGAGFDVFLASKQVGPSGRAIGVDMNKDMLTLAAANKTKAGSSADNISFIESQITAIDLPDTIANCIISNCVINLVPEEDKPRVFAEMYRLLKPGGRVAVSDILAKKPLPETLRNSMALYAGCIAGASLVSQYEGYLKEAGFEEILIADTNADLNVYIDTLPDGTKRVRKQQGESQSSCCAPAPAAAQSCCAPAPMVQQSACCSQTPSSTPCCSKEKLAGGCCKDGMAEEGCCDSKVDKKAVMEELNAMLQTLDLNEWVGSFKVYAVKH